MPALQKLLNFLNAFIPPIAWATFIYLLSDQSNLPGPPGHWQDWLFKESAHVFVYAVLYFLVWRAIHLLLRRSKPMTHIWLSLLICVLYALSDEVHQSSTPTREPSLEDIGFDTFGAVLTLLWLRRKTKRGRLTT